MNYSQQPLLITIPQKKKMNSNPHLLVCCDGGARGNPGHSAIGFLIKNNQGKVLVKEGRYIGKATNNVAEYSAVIAALTWLVKHQSSCQLPASCQFCLDSQLVVNQLNGKFKIKNLKLQKLALKVKELENRISIDIYYNYILRNKNYEADRLVNLVLDKIK
jgi:ribonuclease HI